MEVRRHPRIPANELFFNTFCKCGFVVRSFIAVAIDALLIVFGAFRALSIQSPPAGMSYPQLAGRIIANTSMHRKHPDSTHCSWNLHI